jgi:hypothetical protein
MLLVHALPLWPAHRRTTSAFTLACVLAFTPRALGEILFSQNFEGLALSPFISPTEAGGDGTDWTDVPPAGWTRDNPLLPVGPPPEFRGFTFLDIDSWISTEADQARSLFTRGGVGSHGTIMVADPDAFDDGTDIDPNLFTAFIRTPAISLSGVRSNSVQITFDSSFRPARDQTASLEVSFNGGVAFQNLLTFTTANSGGEDSTARINETISIPVNNPASGMMVLRFRLANAGNDWWWAIDNLTITGMPRLAATLTVTNNHDNGAGSLRQAIQDAAPGDTISFAFHVSGTITLTSGELLIGKTLNIFGPCAKQLAISGNNASRVFNVTNGTVRISGLSIVNGATPFLTGRGGGILQTGGTLFLDQCRIASNSAAIGGGIDMLGGTLVISNSAICYNTCFSTGSSGGGTEPDGGGIATEITSANLTIINSTISGNTISASGGSTVGGGIYSIGPLQMTNCTVANNVSMSFAGGIRRGTSTARIANCIIASNSAPSFPDVSGTFVSDGYNLVGNTSGGSGFGATGDLLNTNALLGPLAENGGCTPTHALLAGSPALDKGNGFGLTTDQRGAPRPFDFASIANASGGDGSDIGAFESGSPPLNIQKAGSSVVLSWPSYYGGFTLESVTNLPGSNGWTSVGGSAVVIGSEYQQTNSRISGNQFFRLRGN